MKDDVIILSRMYVGKYLEEENHIGHEIINLFAADNGKNYIYVNHDGKINPIYNDRVQAVLLVRYVEKGVMEVIAKATGLKQVLYTVKDIKADVDSQIRYVKENGVDYGGVPLSDVYKSGDEQIVITFEAAEIRKPRRPLFIYEDVDKGKMSAYENGAYLPEKHFSSQSLKMYYPQNEYPGDFDVLSRLIADSGNWELENTTSKINIDDYEDFQRRNSFLAIIGKQYDELVFSNLLEYIFESNRKLFVDFAKDVLGIPSFDTKFEVEREEATDSRSRVDLWIESKNAVIVIENKIKAKINGVKHNLYSDEDGAYQSQLSEYYKYAEKRAKGKSIYCFIFSPDYNAISLEKFVNGEEYTVVKYSQIYDFYFKHAGSMLHINYFSEFLDAMATHKDTVDNSNFENMRSRFIAKIKRIREEKNS